MVYSKIYFVNMTQQFKSQLNHLDVFLKLGIVLRARPTLLKLNTSKTYFYTLKIFYEIGVVI